MRKYLGHHLRSWGLLVLLVLLVWGAPAGLVAAQTPESSSLPLEAGTAGELDEPPIGFHLARGDALHMEAAQTTGGSFAVVVFNWANIEPAPNYRYWETPDAAVRAAEFYGLDLIARLDQPPAWALDEDGPTPWNLEAYAAFSRRVAERYGSRLAGIVVWNEPNLSLEWNDRPPDAAAYTEMLKATYPVLKAAAPDVPVLMGALASTEGEGDWAVNDLDYLQALYDAGAAAYFDILTAHTYGFGRPPDDAPEKFRPNFRRLELYREIMTANNDSQKPVWVTEMGWLIRSDDPRHDWQLVSPETQADYTLQAITYAARFYPWLERLGIWALDSSGDQYGYGIWQGPQAYGPAYEALVDRCVAQEAACRADHSSLGATISSPIPILAPDTVIRLGDRGTLHPHWVHLHRSGQNFSPDWSGEFFLSPDQAGQDFDLVLETMQIDQSTNRLFINDRFLAQLEARPRPDPTSSWVSQRFHLPSVLLRPGLNVFSVAVGPRNATRQYVAGRWENMQFRHVRLVQPYAAPSPVLLDWQPQPAPSGWSETNRLRAGLADDLWLTGIRPGELWHASLNPEQINQGTIQPLIKPGGRPKTEAQDKPGRVRVASPAKPLADLSGLFELRNEAGPQSDLIFNDVLATPQGELAATHQGLVWRVHDQPDWQPIAGIPPDHAYVIARANDQFYAGFEQEGLWSSPTPTGPWQRTTLTATSVIDLVTTTADPSTQSTEPGELLYAISKTEVYTTNGRSSGWVSVPLPGLTQAELDEAGESPGDKFRPRIFALENGQVVIRHQDRMWRPTANGWEIFGPEKLHGKQFSVLNCCDAGALVGSNDAGLWLLEADGVWQRFDSEAYFNSTDITELLKLEDRLYAAGDLGLFLTEDDRSWQKAAGLPATVSDLLADPADPDRWLAGTPAGVYRSQDQGQSWEAISPPWTVWDLAFSPQGRLYVGRSNGLAWVDDLSSDSLQWERSDDMQRVYFLRVNPHPVDSDIVWAGTWGNNIGASQDGGKSITPVHNGLETLSGLDLIWHPTPGQITLATFEGLYRTDDGGQRWFQLPGPLQKQTVYSLLQTDEGTIWAGAANGLWFSRDYGVSWEQSGTLPQATVLRLGSLEVVPEEAVTIPLTKEPFPARVYARQRWLWAGTEGAGLWLSQDGGDSWHLAGLPGRTIFNIFFDPLQSRRLIAATDQGIFAVTVTDEAILAMTGPSE